MLQINTLNCLSGQKHINTFWSEWLRSAPRATVKTIWNIWKWWLTTTTTRSFSTEKKEMTKIRWMMERFCIFLVFHIFRVWNCVILYRSFGPKIKWNNWMRWISNLFSFLLLFFCFSFLFVFWIHDIWGNHPKAYPIKILMRWKNVYFSSFVTTTAITFV